MDIHGIVYHIVPHKKLVLGNMVNISTKLTQLCSALSAPSDERNSISRASFIGGVGLFVQVNYFVPGFGSREIDNSGKWLSSIIVEAER